MRQLHVVGLTDDGGHLLLAARAGAAKGTHRIEVDERLRAALRGSLPPPGHAAAESALSPKEIQARLRGGETPEQVARVAGVPVARVLRYAEPVLAERRRVVDEARAATMIRPRRGASLRPLGDAVDEHLAATAGLRPDTVDWSARRRDDGCWVVRLSFLARGRSRTAQWVWDPAARAVSAVDPGAAELGHVALELPPAPRRRRLSSAKAATPARTRPKPATAKAPAKSVTAKPVPAGKPPATRKPVPTRKPPARRSPRPAEPAPDVKAGRAAAGRAKVPSWSDVLLGVQPTQPARRR